MKIIETKNLCKIYGAGEAAITALDHVNFTVNRGEFVAITGPSGSGKSTLLHMLGAVDSPSSGTIFYEGKDIYQYSEQELSAFRRRQIGFVFQFYNLLPVLTVEENILLPLKLDKRKIDRNRFEDILSTLGLADRRTHLPNQLSGGQQQRVAIGRALINDPTVILADEPTGNLDIQNGREILAVLRASVKKYGQTLIIITHDANIANQAQRAVYIADGRLEGN